VHPTVDDGWDNGVVMDVLAAGEAARTLPPLPAWSTVVFAAAGLWWFGCLVGAIRGRTLRIQRRFYWTGYGGVAALCGVAMSPRGWELSVWTVAVVIIGCALWALRTGYLKIGGRLLTVSAVARRRDERESRERDNGEAAQQATTRR